MRMTSSLRLVSLRRILVGAILSLAPLGLIAQNTPDPAVAEAASQLATIAAEFEGMKAGDFETGQRLMKQLAPIGAKLGTLSNRTHPAWRDAAAKYNSLNTGIPAKVKAGVQTSAPPDSALAQLDAELAAYEEKLAAMPAGDFATGSRYLAELKTVGTRISGAANKTHPTYSPIVKRYNALNTALADKTNRAPANTAAAQPAKSSGPALSSMQQTQFNRLSRDIARSISIVTAATEPELLDAAKVQSWRTAASNHRVNLGNIGRADHSEVTALGPEIDRLVALIDQRVAGASGSRQALGDYEARLATIEKNYSSQPVPGALSAPFVAAEMRDYATRVIALRDQTSADLAYLQKLAPSQFAPQNMSSRIYWQKHRADELAKSLESTRANIDAHVAGAMRYVTTIAASERDAKLSEEELFATWARHLGETAGNLEGAIAFFQTLGDNAAVQTMRASLATVTAEQPRLEKRFEQAVANVRLPKAVSTDSALLRAAREALSTAGYNPGNAIEAMVINAPVKRVEKKEGNISSGAVYTTVTVYNYVWDQFQVTTAEKVGDRHYLFYNTLKYFHSGAATTPTGRWVVGDRFKGGLILKKNLP